MPFVSVGRSAIEDSSMMKRRRGPIAKSIVRALPSARFEGCFRLIWLTGVVMVVAVMGCTPQYHVRATDYQVKVNVDPVTHTLVGRATLTLRPIEDREVPEGSVWVGFDLNEKLSVSDVRVDGARLKSRRAKAPRKSSEKASSKYRSHILTLDRAAADLVITVDYSGELHQDVEAGEKAGEIHNFGVSAHIAPEGTYLAPGGYWYPTPVFDNEDEVDPDLFLANWRLEADRIDDYELVASAHRDESETDGYAWNSPHRLTGVMLAGGPHDVWSKQISGVDLRVHLQHTDDADEKNANETIARNYLDHVSEYIERYEPLLGPFPYEQYTIVENFFSSGFAFPTMTLFGPAVMHMGDNSFRHGYLDHELVHSWWGCGVEVDQRDGNWCEALTTYCTNYHGFVLDGDSAGARKKRRDHSNFLSRIKPKHDKPLGTFGLDDGAGRGIAYSKGAAVFHMLARTIGQDEFWHACRILTERYMGRHASWDDLKAAFEEAGGRNLDEFFEQWVRGGGAPSLTLVSADYDAARGMLSVEIDQGNDGFAVDLPLRVHFDDGHEDIVVGIRHAHETLSVPVDRAPRSVELDPDYHVFRKLKRSEIMPTTAITKSAKTLTIVVPPGKLLDGYATVRDDFENSRGRRRAARTIVADDSLEAGALAAGGVLILGDAARHPVVRALLTRTDCPIDWTAGGFAIGERSFTEPGHAVLCSVHHPDTPDDGVTIYAGNSEDALANAAILGFYANSMLVFEAGDRTEVVLRRDFESRQVIDLTAATPESHPSP